jgi:hypothetical protein
LTDKGLGRLVTAFALAPFGAFVVALPFTLSTVGLGDETGPVVFLALVLGSCYVVGLVLLPVFFWLERSNRAGWQFYVPIATVAGLVAGFVMDEPTFSGRWGLYVLTAAAGAFSGAVFSVVLVCYDRAATGPST